MLNGLYYLLTLISFVFMLIIIFFTVYRFELIDKTGREYNASFFIAVPLIIINMIILVILAFQSWNVEVAYIDLAGEFQVEIMRMPYLCYTFYVLFLIHILFIAWNSFEFFIDSAYEPKGNFQH